MHPDILAKRRAIVDGRIRAAALQLGERFGIEPVALTKSTNNPTVTRLLEAEAVADFLDRLTALEPLLVSATSSRRKAISSRRKAS